jgi:hypothetical protein
MSHKFYLFLLILTFQFLPAISQTVKIKGSLININTDRKVSGVRIVIVALDAYFNESGAQYEAFSDEYGEFVFDVPTSEIPVPGKVMFKVNDKNFIFFRGERVQIGKTINLKIRDQEQEEIESTKLLIGQVQSKQIEIKNQIKNSKYKANSKESVVFEKIFDSLRVVDSTLQALQVQLSDGKVALKKADIEISNISSTMKSLLIENAQLKNDLRQASLQFVDAHCQGVSNDNRTLTFLFKVMEKDGTPVLNEDIAIRVEIDKLEGVKKDSKNFPVRHISNNAFYDLTVRPNPYVTVSFTAILPEFVSKKSNYTIKVFNRGFDERNKAFIDKELWYLESNCSPIDIDTIRISNPKTF